MSPVARRRLFSLRDRLASFGPALRGLRLLVAAEHNARIHAAITVIVVALGAVSGLDRLEWSLVVVAAATVWLAEALNTAVERLADAVSLERRPLLGPAKDLAAAAVLLAALGAVLVGLFVFGPRLVRLLG